jgi:hypothetical protein
MATNDISVVAEKVRRSLSYGENRQSRRSKHVGVAYIRDAATYADEQLRGRSGARRALRPNDAFASITSK